MDGKAIMNQEEYKRWIIETVSDILNEGDYEISFSVEPTAHETKPKGKLYRAGRRFLTIEEK